MKCVYLFLGMGAMASLWLWLRTPDDGMGDPRKVGGTAVLPARPAAGAHSDLGGHGKPALQLARELSDELADGRADKRDHAVFQLLPELVAVDPVMASKLVLEYPGGLLRDDLIRQYVRARLALDVHGTLEWVVSLAVDADRKQAGQYAVEGLSHIDMAGAVDLALVLGIGLQDGSLEHRVQIWTEEKPDEAVAWALGKPSGPDRDRLLARIAQVRAQKNPQEAATLVMDQLPPGQGRDDAIIGVVRHWAALDPAGASKWVAGFPPGALFDRAVAELGTFVK